MTHPKLEQGTMKISNAMLRNRRNAVRSLQKLVANGILIPEKQLVMQVQQGRQG